MRILVTVPWGEPLGGAEAMLQAVLDGAREEGHELEPVFFQGGSWPRSLAQAGFRVRVLRTGRMREAHKWFTAVISLARIMRSRQPDLILNWAAKTQLYGAPAAALAGMTDRVIWWQHAVPQRNWLDAIATLLPTVAVGCTSNTAAHAQARFFPARRTFVVPAGTPIPDSATKSLPPLDRRQDVPVVGLVGRLQPWKGQDRLLRAQALLRDRGHPMHTLIVGGDAYGLSSEYASSLPGLIDALGLEGSVTLTGQVPEAGPHIEQMDILVNASDPEPFGIVLLEGMSRAVAVVAVDSGGPREFIEHERTGILARSGEPAALADALEPLLSSQATRKAIGDAGHELFLREFTDAALRSRFFAGLQTLVQERQRNSNSHGRPIER